MRKSSSLDALFPQTRQNVLAATLMQPERWWYLSELAKHLKVTPSTLQRELSSLTGAGILEQRADGNRVYYRPDQDCPFISELQGILIKTAGLSDVIIAALNPFADKIACAFVYGSIAKRQELSSSDIDLMVIGDLGMPKLSPNLKKLEKQTGRTINPVLITQDDLRKKLLAKNHFFTQIMADKKIFLLGKKDELERITRN